MVKTNRKRKGYNKVSTTRRKSSSLKNSSSIKKFEKEVTVIFLEMLLMVKLFHWKTHSYATHKATDELYSKLNEDIDKFIEILLGKTGSRIDLMGHKNILLIDLNSQEQLKSKIESFKSYLVGLTNNKGLSSMTNTDLLNIRDEILGDMNQFLYLLTFK
jgi:DNA-binding ferritin-like protein